MDKKMKIILGVCGFLVFIGLAYFGYSALSKQYSPKSTLSIAGGESSSMSSGESETSDAAASDLTDGSASSCSPVPGSTSSFESGSSKAEDTSSDKEKIAAPDFTVTDKDGNEVKLSDYIGEKPIVLNFWASWCPPCKAEMPEFDKVQEEMKEDVLFLMINSTDGQRETVEKGLKYVTDQGFTFKVLYDTKQEGSYQYGIYSLPTTFFIDMDGNIAAGAEGQIDEETLRKGIELIKK